MDAGQKPSGMTDIICECIRIGEKEVILKTPLPFRNSAHYRVLRQLGDLH